ncbi:MAG: sarcosine oxidase subunit gamma [Alphaproteobacteria bacterium]|nr:sarcosine oxidase subunit gamma [Alphaproteobacteria bacterium]|tara:strand:+ start:24 stop:668 length:645 start_codon:yes stop_codon:yes gene_type:complete
MAERYQQQSALAHFGLSARATNDQNESECGVWLGEHAFRGQINLRGDPGEKTFMDAVAKVTGSRLPTKPNTSAGPDDPQAGPRALWLALGEWLVVTVPGAEEETARSLAEVTADCGGTVTDVSDARTVIAMGGRHARDVLMKGCPLDLHPAAFEPGACAQSRLALATVILYRGADPSEADASAFEIHVARSFADYLWTWLEDAAGEYGVRIIEG